MLSYSNKMFSHQALLCSVAHYSISDIWLHFRYHAYVRGTFQIYDLFG